MLATDDFIHDVLVKRPESREEWITLALQSPVLKEVQQEDVRIRHWVWIAELDPYLRVVTLEDGKTEHKAFPDRTFTT